MQLNKIEYQGKTFASDLKAQTPLQSGNCYRARSLLSSSLEIETFEFYVKSTDTTLKDFTIDAPLVYYNGTTRVGTFYVQDVQRVAAYQYMFSCVSAAGLLDKRTHYGGVYTGQTVQEVVTDVCGSMPVTIAANVARIKLYGWLPIATARENLAQVLFATSATAAEDGNGTLNIKGLDNTVKSIFSADQIFTGGSVEYQSPVSQVVVLEHQYIKGDEVADLFEGTASDGDRITFDEPMHTLSATGFTIKSSGDNYAIVSAGSGTLSGKKYIHTTREVVGQRKTRVTVDADHSARVEDATLVSLANSRAVADRLAEYFAHSERITADVIYSGQQAGDVVQMMHPYDKRVVTTCLESVDITLSGAARATTTSLVGYLPPDISQIEYYDTFEILTGSGTWTAPKGVKNLRAVLIGGGDAGTDGKDGENGTSLSDAQSYVGGKGGAAGELGKGGKIFQTEIQNEGSYAYSCGVGGVHNAAVAGSATTFGAYTSESGAGNPQGYTNPFTDVNYARDGKAGAAGGDGGNPNQNGGDVESYTGGAAGKPASLKGANAQGGGGGGAARGANGSDGTNASCDYWGQDAHGTVVYQGKSGDGGDGGNATTTPSYSEYGSGGNAGSGGGGGGAGGEAKNSNGKIGKLGNPGLAGKGSQGHNGVAGCIILFYSLPQPTGG